MFSCCARLAPGRQDVVAFAPPQDIACRTESRRAAVPNKNMKTAYELAMERLNKTAPTVKLTGAQKKELAELDSKHAAKIAGREIALKDEMARAAGDPEKAGALQQQLADERRKLQAELEEKKDAVRRAASR